jgi:hypothetical protein
MWPLGFFLLFAIAGQQSNPAPTTKQHQDALSPAQMRHLQDEMQRRSLNGFLDNTCLTMRSYLFRHDGQAPSLEKVVTCTPANTLGQRQVSHPPVLKIVPLHLQNDEW